MDNTTKEMIDEAEDLLEDQSVVIDLLQEENAELREENKALRGQMAQLMMDQTVEVGVYEAS